MSSTNKRSVISIVGKCIFTSKYGMSHADRNLEVHQHSEVKRCSERRRPIKSLSSPGRSLSPSRIQTQGVRAAGTLAPAHGELVKILWVQAVVPAREGEAQETRGCNKNVFLKAFQIIKVY